MDFEVSTTIRAAIKAKLSELGAHIDDELPDYIMVLIANRRSVTQMETDLAFFLNEKTTEFVKWLSKVLKKLEEVSVKQITSLEEQAKQLSAEVTSTKEAKKIKKLVKRTIMKVKKIANKNSKEAPLGTLALDNMGASVKKYCKADEVKGNSGQSGSANSPDDSSHGITEENENATNAECQPKIKLNITKPKEQAMASAEIFRESDDEEVIQLLNILSDSDDEVSNYTANTDDILLDSDSDDASDSCESLISDGPSSIVKVNESICHSGELMIKSDENDVDELRRIALVSLLEEKQRQTNVIQGVLGKTTMTSNSISTVKSPIEPPLNNTAGLPKPIQNDTGIQEAKSISKTKPGNHITAREIRFRKWGSQLSPSRSRSRSRSRSSVRTDGRQSPINSGSSSSINRSSIDRTGHSRSRSDCRRQSNSDSSRSRSNSPVIRRNSVIGTIINRKNADKCNPIRPKINSVVVKVAEKPKADQNMNCRLLMVTASDLDGYNQDPPDDNRSVRKRRMTRREREHSNTKIITNRRFNEFPEVNSEEFFEPQKASERRKRIKERLGVKRDPGFSRKLMADQLKLRLNNHHEQDTLEEQQLEFSDRIDDDNSLVVKLDGSGTLGASKRSRNVCIASNNNKNSEVPTTNKISVPMDISDDEKTGSDDEEDSSSSESDIHVEIRDAKTCPEILDELRKRRYEFEPFEDSDPDLNDRLEVAISSDDKLPEVPKGHIYVVEEMEIDESKESSLNNSQMEESSQTLSEKIEENRALMKVLAPTIDYPGCTGLTKGKFNHTSSRQQLSFTSLRCKYWPKCVYKDNCKYTHPLCRFNPCANPNCDYKHDNRSLSTNDKPATPTKMVCKFYPACTSMVCSFHHPSPCRFGLGCTDMACQNYHPGISIGMLKLKLKGGTTIPKTNNKLKWIKK